MKRLLLVMMVFLLCMGSVFAVNYQKIVLDNMTSDVLPVPYAASGTTETVSTQRAFLAFDGVTVSQTDYFQANGNAPQSVTLDLGTGNSTVVVGVNFTSTNVSPAQRQYDPANITLMGSNDNSTYTVLLVVQNIPVWAQGETRQFNFSNTIGYRYLQFVINNTNTSVPGAVLFPEVVWLRDLLPTTPPVLTLGVNDTRANFLVTGFTANISNSTYSTTLSTTTTSISITAGRTNATNSSLTLSLNNASFFNGSYRDTSPNNILAGLQGKTLNHGTITGGPVIINESFGKYGKGANVTATGQIKSTTAITNFSTITISTWAKTGFNFTANPTNNVEHQMILFLSNFTYITLVFRNNTGVLRTYARLQSNTTNCDNTAATNSQNDNDDTYRYYTGEFNGTHILLFINGVLNASSAITQSCINYLYTANGPTYNVTQIQQLWNGSVDEQRLWINASLTSVEIINEMNSPYPVRGQDLYGSWSFELNNITAGAVLDTTADTNYLVNGSVNGTGGYYFTGTGDRVNAGNASGVNIVNSSFTLNAWANALTANTARIMIKGNTGEFSYTLSPSGSTMRCLLNNGTGGANQITISDTSAYNVNTWYMWTCNYDLSRSNLTLYRNGIYVSSGTIINAPRAVPENLTIGADDGTGAIAFNGSLTNMKIFNRALSSDEVRDLYLGVDFSLGVYNITFTGVNSSLYFNTSLMNLNFSATQSSYGLDWQNYINFSLSNLVNGSNLSRFSIDVDNGSQHFSGSTTVGSLIIYNLIGNLSINWTSIESNTYFNLTNVSYNNFNTTINLTNSTYQAIINTSVYRLFLNTTIASYNITNWLLRNTTTTSYLLIPANNGTNNLQADIAGNYSTNQTCTATSLTTTPCNITGIYDNRFTIGASHGGIAVLNFTLNVTNTTLGGLLYNTNTTNGSLIFNLLQGYYYTFNIAPPGYGYANTSIPANSSTNLYNFSLFNYNTINFTFYDETTGLSVAGPNITLNMISTSQSATFSTTNGSIVTTLLSPDSYTIQYFATNYTTRSYLFNLTNNTYTEIPLPMLLSSAATTVTVTVIDNAGAPLQGAVVRVYLYDLPTNTYKINQIFSTNAAGIGLISVQLNTAFYYFTVEYQGAIRLITTPTALFSNTLTLTVPLNVPGFTHLFDNNKLYGIITNTTSTLYQFLWTDSDNTASNGCLYAYNANTITLTLYNYTCLNASGGTVTVGLNNNNNQTYYLYGVVTKGGTQYTLDTRLVSYATYPPTENSTRMWLFVMLLIIVTLIIMFRNDPAICLIIAGLVPLLFSSINMIGVGLLYTIPLFIMCIIIAVVVGF